MMLQATRCRKKPMRQPSSQRLFFSFFSGPPRASVTALTEKVDVGQTVKLTCPIQGTPTPMFEWFKVKHTNLSFNLTCNCKSHIFLTLFFRAKKKYLNRNSCFQKSTFLNKQSLREFEQICKNCFLKSLDSMLGLYIVGWAPFLKMLHYLFVVFQT